MKYAARAMRGVSVEGAEEEEGAAEADVTASRSYFRIAPSLLDVYSQRPSCEATAAVTAPR